MIQTKPKQCSVCLEIKRLWKSNPKTCKECCQKNKVATVALKQPIKKQANKTVEHIQKQNARNVFFAEQALLVPGHCENCDASLNAFNFFAKRAVTAHILPKSKFPSVELHPMNRMFLGVGMVSECNCHGTYDFLDASVRVTMKCYPLAIERLQSFKHLLTPKEQVMAEKYLNIEL